MSTWRLILLQEWRFRWSGKFFLLFQLISPAMQLAIYWFTAKALTDLPAEKGWGGLNFFDYVSLGEILILPILALSSSVLRGVSLAHPLGVLDDILLSSKRWPRTILGLGFGALLTDLLTLLITLGIYLSLTDLSFSVVNVFKIIGVLILVTPFFLALSLFAALLFLHYRRGAGIVSYLIMISSIAAGVYFPTQVLPFWLKEFLNWTSPFTIVLENFRRILFSGEMPPASFYVWFLAATCFLLAVNFWFLPRARQKYLSRRVSEVVVNYF